MKKLLFICIALVISIASVAQALSADIIITEITLTIRINIRSYKGPVPGIAIRCIGSKSWIAFPYLRAIISPKTGSTINSVTC